MRTALLSLGIILLPASTARAQLLAGEVPNGATVLDLNIDLQLTEPFTQDGAGLEVDCDDQPDINAVLIHGQPILDAPNLARLDFIDTEMELCMDLETFSRPQYYAYGEIMTCTGAYDWQSDSVNYLGNFGGFIPTGPTAIDSMYVAYRGGGGEVGWILLSFDLTGSLSQPIWLKIHQVLSICGITSIADHDAVPAIRLFPNPTNGQTLQVESDAPLNSIDVLDAAGRVVARYGGTVRTIPAPEEAGTYLVRAIHADGQRSITRLVRY